MKGVLKKLMWIGYLLSAMLILSTAVNSATLTSLSQELRKRINELDLWTSNVDTLHLNQWIRHAEHRVVTLSGYLPIYEDFVYTSGDQPSFTLPTDYRQVKKVFVKSKGRYYPILPNPGFAKDTGIMTYDIVWKTTSSAHLLLSLGGFRDAQTDIFYSADSQTYQLPANFSNVTGVTMWAEGWEPIMPNPYFLKEVGPRQYDIRYKAQDTALLYLRGTFQDDDTVRVFYQRTLETDDTVRIEYRAKLGLQLMTQESTLPDDLENFVVEEAMGYYFLWKKDAVTAARIWEQVRVDMGVVRPREQQR